MKIRHIHIGLGPFFGRQFERDKRPGVDPAPSSLGGAALLAGVSLLSLAALPAAATAASTAYQGPNGGACSNGGYWTNGTPSGSSDTTVNNGNTVATDGGDTTSTLTIGPVGGSGVSINDNLSLSVGSTLSSAGAITLNSAGSTTELQVNNTTVTLSGGGSVTLSNNGNNLILDASGYSGGKLVNVNNAISGAGQLGYGSLSIDNQAAGTINANQSTTLTLQTNGAGATNEGLIEASSGGTLNLTNTTLTQSGGTLLSTGAGSTSWSPTARSSAAP